MNRPICKTSSCSNNCKTNGYKINGDRKYHKYCSHCCKKRHVQGKKPKYKPRPHLHIRAIRKKYGGYDKKKYCEYCKWVALNRCQLDVDHIDGNHYNNEHSNLQTLCANCHRLKTYLNRDNIKNKGPLV